MDAYDEQIAYLTKNPHLIDCAWELGEFLFKRIGEGQYSINYSTNETRRPGCLTQIRLHPDLRAAYINGVIDNEITEQIKKDVRIPKESTLITVDHLPVFAEWQRRIDAIALERRINKFD